MDRRGRADRQLGGRTRVAHAAFFREQSRDPLWLVCRLRADLYRLRLFLQKGEQLPWAVSAVSGALHFWLIYEVVFAVYPQLRNGILPVLFIVPYAFGVFYLIKEAGSRSRFRRCEPGVAGGRRAFIR